MNDGLLETRMDDNDRRKRSRQDNAHMRQQLSAGDTDGAANR
jgi:hypothetical protein